MIFQKLNQKQHSELYLKITTVTRNSKNKTTNLNGGDR